MKRSEMVEHIAEQLLTSSNYFGGDREEQEEARDRTKMRRLKLAHLALKAAEEAGTLPPSYEGLIATGKKFDQSTDQDRDTALFSNRWEPENAR